MRAITVRRSLTGIIAAAGICTVALSAPSAPAQQTGAPAIADFFRDYAAEWVRMDPDRARATRYFTGAEQDRLERQLGPFPFPSFWGPRAGLPCTQWIARCAAEVVRGERPDLTLVYLARTRQILDHLLNRRRPSSSGSTGVDNSAPAHGPKSR